MSSSAAHISHLLEALRSLAPQDLQALIAQSLAQTPSLTTTASDGSVPSPAALPLALGPSAPTDNMMEGLGTGERNNMEMAPEEDEPQAESKGKEKVVNLVQKIDWQERRKKMHELIEKKKMSLEAE
jgi:hypothetical protein